MSLSNVMMTDSPLLLWMMDELTGTVFNDISGTGNHGAVSGGATLGAAGPGGLRAAAFNGTNGSCNRDASVGTVFGSLPTGSAARSLEIWQYPTTASTSGAAVGYGLDSNTYQHVVFQGGNYTGAGAAFTDGVNGGNNKAWVTAAPLNAWSHIVMTYAGGAGGAALFYMNAVVDVSTTLSLTTTASPNRVRAGLRSDDGRATGYFPGRLAAAAIYSGVLSADRIRSHYEEGRRTLVVVE